MLYTLLQLKIIITIIISVYETNIQLCVFRTRGVIVISLLSLVCFSCIYVCFVWMRILLNFCKKKKREKEKEQVNNNTFYSQICILN